MEQLHEHTGLAWPREEFFWKEPKSSLLSIFVGAGCTERVSREALVVKNLPADAGDVRDTGSIPRSGRSPGGVGMATCSSVLAWRIPWTEETGGPQSIGS